jgi:hypothetical protein
MVVLVIGITAALGFVALGLGMFVLGPQGLVDNVPGPPWEAGREETRRLAGLDGTSVGGRMGRVNADEPMEGSTDADLDETDARPKAGHCRSPRR